MTIGNWGLIIGYSKRQIAYHSMFIFSCSVESVDSTSPIAMSRLKHFAYYWIPVIGYCLMIFIQSSFPASERIPEFDFSDKLLHAGAFALLGLLVYRALNAMERRRFTVGGLVVLSISFTVLYGASDEIHQYFVPSRSAEFLDFAADAIGGIIGVMAGMIIFKSRRGYIDKNPLIR